jgi:hypothetical protein
MIETFGVAMTNLAISQLDSAGTEAARQEPCQEKPARPAKFHQVWIAVAVSLAFWGTLAVLLIG